MSEISTVLLVTGDPVERTMVADYLRGCGYHVIVAADGDEAKLALQSRSIDVIVTDIELPYHGSGHTLAAWARANRPDLEVILTSSLERTAQAAAELCEEQSDVRQRYHPQELVEEIQRLKRRAVANT